MCSSWFPFEDWRSRKQWLILLFSWTITHYITQRRRVVRLVIFYSIYQLCRWSNESDYRLFQKNFFSFPKQDDYHPPGTLDEIGPWAESQFVSVFSSWSLKNSAKCQWFLEANYILPEHFVSELLSLSLDKTIPINWFPVHLWRVSGKWSLGFLVYLSLKTKVVLLFLKLVCSKILHFPKNVSISFVFFT